MVSRFGGGRLAPCWGRRESLRGLGAEIGGAGLDRGAGLCHNVIQIQGTFESGAIVEGQKAAPRVFFRVGFLPVLEN